MLQNQKDTAVASGDGLLIHNMYITEDQLWGPPTPMLSTQQCWSGCEKSQDKHGSFFGVLFKTSKI